MKPDKVLLGHGSGGRMMRELIEAFFVPAFGGSSGLGSEDSAVLDVPPGRLAVTTDSYVVNPIFFPGGNIGDLAVNGTVNDLAMAGAQPLYITCGFIIEEGLPLADLETIVASMKAAADTAGVKIVAGDTKVVDRGKADRIFVNTAGVGVMPDGVSISSKNLRAGDRIIISGTIGDHGMAVMARREGLEFQADIVSDSAALNGLVRRMLEVCPEVHALRDPTRGGVTSTLTEFAEESGVGIVIEEKTLPIREAVRGACEILGLDPLYVANEGKLIASVPAEKAHAVLNVMKSDPLGKDAVVIGEVVAEPKGRVLMKTLIGGTRIVDMLSGEQLPRIC